MPVGILVNQCTPLGIINSTSAIVYGVVSHLNIKNISLKQKYYN